MINKKTLDNPCLFKISKKSYRNQKKELNLQINQMLRDKNKKT